MRALLVTTILATTTIASPALAQDQGFYAGIEGGVMWVKDVTFDYEGNNSAVPPVRVNINDAYELDHKRGYDVDAIAGYDFGGFRVEAEVGYKRAKVDDVGVADAILVEPNVEYDADGRSSAVSVMLNALADFGLGGVGAYVGGGLGMARVKHRFDVDPVNPALGNPFFRGRDRGLAWQAIAGIRAAVSPTMDVGLKYRYFNVSKLRFDGDGPAGPFEVDSRWRSHSLLASLVFNMGRVAAEPAYIAPAAPPPAPVAPATQVCPDGSVILATDMCPMAPPPPPPPPPPGERG